MLPLLEARTCMMEITKRETLPAADFALAAAKEHLVLTIGIPTMSSIDGDQVRMGVDWGQTYVLSPGAARKLADHLQAALSEMAKQASAD